MIPRWIPYLGTFVLCVGGATSTAHSVAIPIPDGWALTIVDKSIDEENNILELTLINQGDLSVTAFGVAVVEDDGSGRGSNSISNADLIPDQVIAPGATYEMRIDLDQSIEGRRNAAIRSAKLAYEIRSDNSSNGDKGSVSRVFELRAARLREAERTLNAIGALKRGPSPHANTIAFLQSESRRGFEAGQALVKARQDDLREPEQVGLLASRIAGRQAEELIKRLESGILPEQVVREYEYVLRTQRDLYQRNVRPVDLQGGSQ